MTLIKTSLLSLISTVMKMLAGVVVSKAMAVYVGPAGFALVGQFQNFVQLLTTAAKGGIDTGVTKYTAEYHADPARLAQLFSTASRIMLGASLIVGIGLIVSSGALSENMLKTSAYRYVFVVFGFTVVLFAINHLLLAILNGLHEIRLFVAINILQSLLTLVLTFSLVVLWGLDGALIALVTNQSLVLFVTLWALRRHAVIRLSEFRQRLDRPQAVQLSRYALMTAVSAIVAPATTMLVREHIGDTLGLQAAGFWQAAWYVSSIYLTIVTTTLSVYYLPKLAGLHESRDIRRELRGGFRIILPIAALAAFCVYLGRHLLVRIVFTREFEPMADLFVWMLVGDVIKIAAWLLAYLMLAKAMTKVYIATELIFSASFVGLTYLLIPHFGAEGVMLAHALNYFAYLLCIGALTWPVWRARPAE